MLVRKGVRHVRLTDNNVTTKQNTTLSWEYLLLKKRPGRGVSILQKSLDHEEEKEDTETTGVHTARTVGEKNSVANWVLNKVVKGTRSGEEMLVAVKWSGHRLLLDGRIICF